jgi:hypothetical protein
MTIPNLSKYHSIKAKITQKQQFMPYLTNTELRQMVNSLLQQYCADTSISPRDAWHILYDNLQKWKNYNVIEKWMAREPKKTKLDQIEQDNMLEALFCVAYKTFVLKNDNK